MFMLYLPKIQYTSLKRTLRHGWYNFKTNLTWKIQFPIVRLYKRLGLYSNFELSKPTQVIDRVMDPWKLFAGYVTAWGDGDGYAGIHTTDYKYDLSGALTSGWHHYDSPHFFLEILEDGTVVDLTSTESKFKDTPEEHPERILWVVEAKAGLLGATSKYQVRFGFWTRIVSESLADAITKTIKLWEEEHNKSEKVKTLEESLKKSKENFLKYVAYEGFYDAWILDTEYLKLELENSELNDAHVAMRLFNQLENLDASIVELKPILRSYLAPYELELQSIKKACEYTETTAAGGVTSWDDLQERLNLSDKLLEILDKKIKAAKSQ